MALPASPPISMAQVYAEFGGAGQPLTAFVRGGAYVPNTGTNAGVPTAPPISLLNLLGAQATPPVNAIINPATYTGDVIVPPAAMGIIVLTFSDDGYVYTAENGLPNVNRYQWRLAGANSDFQFMLTMTSGITWSGPAAGVWHDMTGLAWGLQTTSGVGNQTVTGTGTVACRNKTTLAPISSASITLRAMRSN